MGLTIQNCYSCSCDNCKKEFETEIDGVLVYHFLSEIELYEQFYDKDWVKKEELILCNKCNNKKI